MQPVADFVPSVDGMGMDESNKIVDVSQPLKLGLRVIIEEDGVETVAYEDPEITKQNKEAQNDC